MAWLAELLAQRQHGCLDRGPVPGAGAAPRARRPCRSYPVPRPPRRRRRTRKASITAVRAQRRLDHIGDVALVGLRVEVGHDPCRRCSGAGSGRSRCGPPRPTARPSRRGTGTRSPWWPWSRSTAPPGHGRAAAGSRPSGPGPAASCGRRCASTGTTPDPCRACRRTPAPSARTPGRGR